jgi:hypothetical protein
MILLHGVTLKKNALLCLKSESQRQTIRVISYVYVEIRFVAGNVILRVQSKSVELTRESYARVFPKVSGLAARSENCKWYSPLPLGAVLSLFVSQFSEFCLQNPLCCSSKSVYCCFSLSHKSGNFWIHPRICSCETIRLMNGE